MKTEIEKFKQYLEQRYPERSTAKHYISDLRIFGRSVNYISPKEIKPKLIDEFVQEQSRQGKKGETINRRLASLSSFFDFLIEEAEDDGWSNPVRWKRQGVKLGRHLPRDVSDETVSHLFGVHGQAPQWLEVGDPGLSKLQHPQLGQATERTEVADF